MDIRARIAQLQKELADLQEQLILEDDLYEHKVIEKWILTPSRPEDGDYLYISHREHPGIIQLKADDEGFVVDIYADDDNNPDSITTTYAHYTELATEPAT